MNSLQKIKWSIVFKQSKNLPLDLFYQCFNHWIPNSPEIFVDVVSYVHVYGGVKLFLAGHYESYAIEEIEEKTLFFSYLRNGVLSESDNALKLKITFKNFIKRFLDFKSFEDVSKKCEFNASQLIFQVNDRAIAPNKKETFDLIKKDLSDFFDFLLGKNQVQLIYEQKDKRSLFLIKIVFNKDIFDWKDLFEKLK